MGARAETGSVVLEYGKHRPRFWRNFWLAVAGVLVAGVIFCCLMWGKAWYRHVAVYYWQGRCLNYTAPATQVVYEEDVARGEALVRADGRNYFQGRPRSMESYGDGRPPKEVVGDPLTIRRVTEWEHFARALPTATRFGFAGVEGPVLFMHERETPKGEKRLVVVSYDPESDLHLTENIDLMVQEMEPGTLGAYPRDIPGTMFYDVMGSVLPPKHMRFYAGQADAKDATHFMIDYEAWGQRDTVDGWLENSGEIRFVPRHKPVPPGR